MQEDAIIDAGTAAPAKPDKPAKKKTTKPANKKPAAKKTTAKKPAKAVKKTAPATKKATGAAANKAKRTRKPEDGPRRSRGQLEDDVLDVVVQLEKPAGRKKAGIEDGDALTPHRIAQAMVKLDTLDSAPSAGAVTNIIAKWRDRGFCTATKTRPFAFTGFTAATKKASSPKAALAALREKNKGKASK